MIEDKFDRSRLSEGRTSGLGYAILKKAEDEKYVSLTGYSACKDYFNDFLFIESTGVPLPEIHGFSHEFTGVIKEREPLYVAIKPIRSMNDEECETSLFKKCKKFISNYENYIKALNLLEDALLFDEKSTVDYVFEDSNEDLNVIIKLSTHWFVNHFTLSAVLLYLRVKLNIEDLSTALSDATPPTLSQDNYYLKVKSILENREKLFCPYRDGKELARVDKYELHSGGIKHFISEGDLGLLKTKK